MSHFLDRRTGRRSALIVSPEPDSRTIYMAALSSLVDEVDYAEDGRDALAKAFGTLPTLVVTEEQLPYFNGDILCSLLRNDPLTSNMRMLVITPDVESMVTPAQQCGANLVMIAPVEQAVLSQAVSDTLDLPAACGYQSAAGSAGRAGRGHSRSETSIAPPASPPSLRCPTCDHVLQYMVSYIGGAFARREQWDSFVCRTCPEQYDYRHRTRALRAVRE